MEFQQNNKSPASPSEATAEPHTSDHLAVSFKKVRLSESVAHEGEIEVPVDKGNAIYLTCLLYGIGVLLPFNVIMACLDFYATTVSVL